MISNFLGVDLERISQELKFWLGFFLKTKEFWERWLPMSYLRGVKREGDARESLAFNET
jgi:hypothetical protein